MQGWKNVALGGFIMVAFVAFVILAVETFYKNPKYEDFFTPPPVPADQMQTEESCERYGGKWMEYGKERYPVPARPAPNHEVTDMPAPNGWCEINFHANEKWETARAVHDRNAAIGIGVLAFFVFVVGMFRSGLPVALSGGLSFGGIVLTVFNLGRYWGEMNEYIRFVYLGLVLLFLVVIAFRYANDKSGKKDKEAS